MSFFRKRRRRSRKAGCVCSLIFWGVVAIVVVALVVIAILSSDSHSPSTNQVATQRPARATLAKPTDRPSPMAIASPTRQTMPSPEAVTLPATARSAAPTLAALETGCYPHSQAWLTGNMNIRQSPATSARILGNTSAGENYAVAGSRRGADYCWLDIEVGWIAVTNLVRATKPQVAAAQPSPNNQAVQQALAALQRLTVAPENRCSPYDSGDYSYPQSVEAQIVSRMGGRIYGPYSGTSFASTSETDIEHIVAKSEAHDSGLCAASAQTRKAFARDLLNLTLAAPSLNRYQKIAKDFAEWTPALNKCWYASTIIQVKLMYSLSVDSREKAALEQTLRGCPSVGMVFADAPAQPAAQPARVSQPTAPRQNAQPATENWRQWDTNGNGRITCAEARAAGIAPVHRGHPAYPRMDDRDNDGVVCE